ncbi:phage virion morphogenesis protein [Desulforegula conservatrix]|uniref:phage virion morphogenesis protein n=1 Tax=Desulforegula conservatrix TaxID=153026 RepID=UPI000407C2F9|nr:phage virion morphogenesis protein [Desulforegula conservatrix]
MSVNINISLEGKDKIQTMLAELERKAGDLTPAMKSIGEHVVSVARLSFRFEKTPTGLPWPKSDRALKEGGQTLSDKGRLKNSITSQVSGNSVIVGTNVKYAAIHQFGFNGRISIKAHQRKVTQAFGKKLKFPVWASIRAHQARMFMVDRQFLPTSLEEVGVSDVEEIIIHHLTKGNS